MKFHIVQAASYSLFCLLLCKECMAAKECDNLSVGNCRVSRETATDTNGGSDGGLDTGLQVILGFLVALILLTLIAICVVSILFYRFYQKHRKGRRPSVMDTISKWKDDPNESSSTKLVNVKYVDDEDRDSEKEDDSEREQNEGTDGITVDVKEGEDEKGEKKNDDKVKDDEVKKEAEKEGVDIKSGEAEDNTITLGPDEVVVEPTKTDTETVCTSETGDAEKKEKKEGGDESTKRDDVETNKSESDKCNKESPTETNTDLPPKESSDNEPSEKPKKEGLNPDPNIPTVNTLEHTQGKQANVKTDPVSELEVKTDDKPPLSSVEDDLKVLKQTETPATKPEPQLSEVKPLTCTGVVEDKLPKDSGGGPSLFSNEDMEKAISGSKVKDLSQDEATQL